MTTTRTTDLLPDAPLHVALADQIACVKREIAMRRKVYPRWVADGRMTQAKADRETAIMEAVLTTLETHDAD